MRLLFEINAEANKPNLKTVYRPSVRGIIIKDKKIAMVHSLRYDYYKFPGGGIDNGESNLDTLIREVKEESGLIVKPETVKEYGLVIRYQNDKEDETFIQKNYYYFCDSFSEVSSQDLDDYEDFELFTLEYVDPKVAIEANRFHDHLEKNNNRSKIMFEREARVLDMLIEEGYFK